MTIFERAFRVFVASLSAEYFTVTTSSRACKAAMAAASLACTSLFARGSRPLGTRGAAARRAPPSAGVTTWTAPVSRCVGASPVAAATGGAFRLSAAARGRTAVRCPGSLLDRVRALRAVAVAASTSEDSPAAAPDAATEESEEQGEGGVSASDATTMAEVAAAEEDAREWAPRAAEEEVTPGASFAQLGMPEYLCAALEGVGFKEPSPPQVSAKMRTRVLAPIPSSLENRRRFSRTRKNNTPLHFADETSKQNPNLKKGATKRETQKMPHTPLPR